MSNLPHARVTIACVAAIFVSVTACHGSDDDGLKTQAMQRVSAVLKDPDSAKFQNLRVVTNSKGQQCVCGEVNARNSFGGYTGYKEFAFAGGVANILDGSSGELHQYALAGCGGPKIELEARLEDEAHFNCEVIWNLIVNVVVQGQDKDAALDAAVTAVRNRAKTNGGSISAEQERTIRAQFRQSLDQTLSNKQQVKAIRKDAKYQEDIFVTMCTANTLMLLKTQVGNARQ